MSVEFEYILEYLNYFYLRYFVVQEEISYTEVRSSGHLNMITVVDITNCYNHEKSFCDKKQAGA